MTETENAASTEPTEQDVPISMAEFLETCPPNQERWVTDVVSRVRFSSGNYGEGIATPEIQLHCTDEACNGLRFFRCTSEPKTIQKSWSFVYTTYKCSNCQRVTKRFAFAAMRPDDDTSLGQVYKIGEIPPFGPPTPPRLIKLIGPDRDLFLQGRRCENQGLGIGAFVYYRRVVENQKNRIISEIIKVASKLGVEKEALDELELAIKETQFTKALDSVKHGIPQALLINGHNPLLLLHNALSDGVHGRTDADCLELASNVRVVLIELADRLSQAMKDEVELNNAVSKLAAIRSKG